MLPAESWRKRAIDKRFPQEFLDIVLNSENGAIPGRSDLPSLWRLIPPEKLSSRNPEYPARLELLGAYINFSHTKSWAREGLRRLLREFLDNREDVPEILNVWALHQCAKDAPTPSRGRPEEIDRNFRVCALFILLRRHGYSREAAFNFIADHLVCAPETVRSIIRKWETGRAFRRVSGPCARNHGGHDSQE